MLALGVVPASATPGQLDRAFGIAGRVWATPLAVTFFPVTQSLAQQPDGKLVVVGTGADALTPNFNPTPVLARFLPDGSPDPSFGTAGAVTSTFVVFPLQVIIIQADGKIVVGGAWLGGKIFLGRWDATGALDTSFGTGGSVQVALPGSFSPTTLVQQPDGKLVVAGSVQTGTSWKVALARFETDGTLDGGFGSGGTTTLDFGDPSFAGGLVLLPGGKLLLSGMVAPANRQHPVLARFGDDGTLDPTFGSGGVANGAAALLTLDVAPGPAVLQPDGKVLVAGYGQDLSNPTPMEPSLLRWNADGTIDTTFGSGGVVLSPAVTFSFPEHGLALQPDGKIVLAAGDGVMRFLGNGSPDGGFGVGGRVLDPGPGAVVVASDGGIVTLAHETGRYTAQQVAFSMLVRYLGGTCGDGVLDAGEDCDDGNTIGGDGCDAVCCTADADGDGVCDGRDPCVGTPTVAAKPKVLVRGLNRLPGKLTMQGELALPLPFTPALDPATKGVRVVLEDRDEPRIDVTIAGGGYADPPKRGWRTRINGAISRWTYIDNSPAPPGGITKVAITAYATTNPGKVKLVATGKHETYPLLGDLPLSGLFSLDAAAGQCATLAFPGPPTCGGNSFTGLISCK